LDNFLELKELKSKYNTGDTYYEKQFLCADKAPELSQDNILDQRYINEGYTAQIKSGLYQGNAIAMKEYSFLKNKKFKQTCFYRETIVLSTISSPNIIKCYGWISGPESRYLVLELGKMDMTLALSRLRLSNPSSLITCISYLTLSIIKALQVLLQHNIYHRDIMLSNILWFGDPGSSMTQESFLSGTIKLCDFGLSKFKDDPPVRCGWPIRLPPQIIVNQYHYCHHCDYYLLGLTVWEAWSDIPLPSLRGQIPNAKQLIFMGWTPPLQSFPNELQEFLKACWRHEETLENLHYLATKLVNSD